jgi:hypothetical protein
MVSVAAGAASYRARAASAGVLPAWCAVLLLCLSWLLASAQAQAQAQEVDVLVDPPILSVGESVNVTFSVVGGGASMEPDFTPLSAQFEILRVSPRERLQIVNGRTTRSRAWRLTLTPREAGTLEIPAIDFGGTLSSPRTITVTPAQTARLGETDVFIELDVAPEGPVYVQSQVLLTVRLFLDTSVRFQNATLSEPEASDGDLVVEHIAEERSQQRLGERNYQVFEQRYALFPQRSGELALAPVVFSADMRSYLQGSAYRRVQSDPITLNVRPAAPSAGSGPWLPATEVTLEQAFPQMDAGGALVARVGEPITRSVTLSALGLTAAQLPPVPVEVPDDFKVYPDQPALDQRITENGVRGERVERLSMLPTQAGDYVLPAVEMSWWDVTRDAPRTARLEPLRLRVLPALPGGADGAAGATAGEVAALPGVDGPAQGGAGAGGTVTVVADPGVWPWLALFLGLGWAATGGLWLRTAGPAFRLPSGAVAPDTGQGYRLGDAVGRVRQACETGDGARVREALLGWARARWPAQRPADLIAVRRLAGEDVAREIDRLDASRYAGESQPWDGKALADAVEAATPSRGGGRGGASTLEPLYR